MKQAAIALLALSLPAAGAAAASSIPSVACDGPTEAASGKSVSAAVHGKTRAIPKARANSPCTAAPEIKDRAATPFARAAPSKQLPSVGVEPAVPAETRGPAGQKPVWEVATVPPDAVQVAKSTYVVLPGDTLSAVVRKTGAGADVIAHDNDIKPPYQLRPGQKLKIRDGRYHTVRKGQSGIAIARAYQVPWQHIVELNHLQEPFTLREGQRLLLPPAQDVAKMSLEQRAAAFKIDLTDLATGSEPALATTAKPAPPTPSPKRELAPTTPLADPVTDFEGRFAWPLEGRVIRSFGPTENGGRNDGITIAAPQGSPIAAAADGVVMWVGQHPAFGNVVLVKHGKGWITIYGNADRLMVRRGQAVKMGRTIALVGMTGTSAARPQMFFEVLQGKKPVNPMRLLPKREGNPSVTTDDDQGDAAAGNAD